MRWNQLADDLPRATALADLLCGAALSDSSFAEEERVVVGAMLMKVMGVTELPAGLAAHLDAFDPAGFDLAGAVSRLALTTDRDRKSVVKVVVDILRADAVLEDTERAYVERLAKALGVADGELAGLLSAG